MVFELNRELEQQQLPQLSVWQFFLWACGSLKRRRVSGRSMEPTLSPGDELLIDTRARFRQRLEMGDIVLCQHPTSRLPMIKRLVSGDIERGVYFVQGDNLAYSSDCHQFGVLHSQHIMGRVVCQFS